MEESRSAPDYYLFCPMYSYVSPDFEEQFESIERQHKLSFVENFPLSTQLDIQVDERLKQNLK